MKPAGIDDHTEKARLLCSAGRFSYTRLGRMAADPPQYGHKAVGGRFFLSVLGADSCHSMRYYMEASARYGALVKVTAK